ncbi:MAG: hypothetical protein M3O32_21720 [Actinomycetota bacterium]|nr:hypothetical protein [Actinomycetota bacterium]
MPAPPGAADTLDAAAAAGVLGPTGELAAEAAGVDDGETAGPLVAAAVLPAGVVCPAAETLPVAPVGGLLVAPVVVVVALAVVVAGRLPPLEDTVLTGDAG